MIMIKESEIQKLKSKYPKFFAQFPSELLEFVFSEETSLGIARICLENGVEDEGSIEKIAYQVTLVLLDQLPKANLTEALKKEVGLNHEIAGKISVAVEERIFPFPRVSGAQRMKQLIKNPPLTETKPKVILPSEPSPETEKKRDTYRESAE